MVDLLAYKPDASCRQLFAGISVTSLIDGHPEGTLDARIGKITQDVIGQGDVRAGAQPTVKQFFIRHRSQPRALPWRESGHSAGWAQQEAAS
jgi:hypothetical protein